MTRSRRPSAVGLAVVAAALAFGGTAVRTQEGSAGRTLVVIGDLHLGPGRDASGDWAAAEDFRWTAALEGFLEAVHEEGGGAVDLVLNGDTFDLWQASPESCAPTDGDRGCSEAEALPRLEAVLSGHADVVAALATFARRGTNTVTMLPGDRDAALAFPAVAARVVEALGGAARVTVAASGTWTSPAGAIHVEHGHQLRGDPFRVEASGGPGPGGQLARTWGERLVQDLYARFESRYPVLDNFASEGQGLKYLAAAEPDVLGDRQLTGLLAFTLLRPAWQQFRRDLDTGAVQPVVWDLTAVRAEGPQAFVESLLPDDPLRPLIARAVDGGATWSPPVDLTADEVLTMVCDSRAAVRRARRRLERSLTQMLNAGPAVRECPRTPETRGSAFEYFWRARDEQYGARLDEIAGLGRRPRVYVQGHTHLPAAFVSAPDGPAPLVVNAGAWIRTITPFQLEELAERQGEPAPSLLGTLDVEALPACYGAVVVPPFRGQPAPELRVWRGDDWGRVPRDAASLEAGCSGGGP